MLMAAVMIGVDPHKASHTAVVISAAEAGKLVAWAAAWPERTWAVEGAGGLCRLLAQQLVAAASGCWTCSRSWRPGCAAAGW
jgi:hypothetical protein